MKVLYFLDTINRGGAEILLLDVCRNAGLLGLDVTIVTAQGGALEDDFKQCAAEFFKLNRRLPLDPKLVADLRKIIRSKKIEIVHAQQPVEAIHLYAATRGIKNIKNVLSFHGFLPNRKNILTAKFLIPRTDANIVVSRGLQKWLAEETNLNTEKFHIIYNGVDEKKLSPSGKASIRDELKIGENQPVLGMVGNFYRDPRKDQITVCKALPRVFKEFPNAKFIFVGKTENGAEEKFRECVRFCEREKIADKVFFAGERKDVPDILNGLDVFVFSSLQEGLPIAVAEAMLAKVSLIVSDIEPLLEATGDGKFARVFPVKNSVILSEKISELLKNPAQRKNLAEKAYRYAMKNFSIETHIAELKKLYKNLSA